jgi:hypothetical protein
MRPNGCIVIVEGFLGEPGKLPPSSMVDTQTALIDLHMLLMTNGRERSVRAGGHVHCGRPAGDGIEPPTTAFSVPSANPFNSQSGRA